MTITKTNVCYTCISSNEILKINGSFAVNKHNKIMFTGNFNTLEDDYCGDFVYYERPDGNINIASNNISEKIAIDSYQLILDCVKKFKLTYFNQE